MPTKAELKELEKLVWFENPAHEQRLLKWPLQRVFEDEGLTLPDPVSYKIYTEFQEAFVKGDVDLMYASTGFWPLDPIGDLQMLFTPNMHEILEGIWTDSKFLALLDKLSQSAVDTSVFDEINMHLVKGIFFASGDGNEIVKKRLNVQSRKLISLTELEIDEEVNHSMKSAVICYRALFKNQPKFVGGKLERLCL